MSFAAVPRAWIERGGGEWGDAPGGHPAGRGSRGRPRDPPRPGAVGEAHAAMTGDPGRGGGRGGGADARPGRGGSSTPGVPASSRGRERGVAGAGRRGRPAGRCRASGWRARDGFPRWTRRRRRACAARGARAGDGPLARNNGPYSLLADLTRASCSAHLGQRFPRAQLRLGCLDSGEKRSDVVEGLAQARAGGRSEGTMPRLRAVVAVFRADDATLVSADASGTNGHLGSDDWIPYEIWRSEISWILIGREKRFSAIASSASDARGRPARGHFRDTRENRRRWPQQCSPPPRCSPARPLAPPPCARARPTCRWPNPTPRIPTSAGQVRGRLHPHRRRRRGARVRDGAKAALAGVLRDPVFGDISVAVRRAHRGVLVGHRILPRREVRPADKPKNPTSCPR